MNAEEKKRAARERAAKWRAEHKWSVERYEGWRRGKRILKWKALEARVEALELAVRRLKGVEW